MMCGMMTAIIAFTFVAQCFAKGLLTRSAHGVELADKLVDRMFDRTLKSPRAQDAAVDRTVLAKPSSVASPSLRMRGPALAVPRAGTAAHKPHGASDRRAPSMSRSPLLAKPNHLSDSADSMDKCMDLLSRESVPEPWKKHVEELRRHVLASGIVGAAMLSPFAALADEAAATATAAGNRFTVVDKTGPIGFLADIIENGIDQVHTSLEGAGVTANAYGLSICLFTLFVRTCTFPLIYTQIDSQAKTQQLAPYRERVMEKFPYKEQERMKNLAVGRLFEAAKVNPLAGCFPALVQFPVFISLYRGLTNLVAEGKLDESFLWLPSLEGPIYGNANPSWLFSAFSGNPALGWDQTKAFATLPLILLFTQTASIKLLSPTAGQTNTTTMTDAERNAQNILLALPLLVASFSLSVPAGLSIYWITNNLLTTSITLAVKKLVKTGDIPEEVTALMRELEGGQVILALKAMDEQALGDVLDKGGDPNEQDGENRSALHFAAGTGYTSLVSKLVDAGANISAVDKLGCTPLYYAAGYGHADVCNYLLGAGAEVTLNNINQSPADAARVNPVNAIRDNDTALLARLEFKSELQEQFPGGDMMDFGQAAKPAPAPAPVAVDPGEVPMNVEQMRMKMAADPAFRQKMQSQMQQMDQMRNAIGQNKELQEKIAALSEDPEIKSLLEEIDKNPTAGLTKLYSNPTYQSKIKALMGDAPAQALAQMGSAPVTDSEAKEKMKVSQ
eukprot:gnl/TRDRNA2_/TRDRNA2_42398_c0_seq2.p1 gnl/TRDRNA2_/TRDRNA2_42398_c0~~gnl/TRDRNA2_/TRDRNA2_42398_c0_seq2.p1  ORF type:complete len:731 (+),score=123.31 gnl/TRDRNA2_/TRDRNA2_42398_c0_seq2:37-2229(+)